MLGDTLYLCCNWVNMALTVPQGSSDALSHSIVSFNCVLAHQEASTRPIEYDSKWEVQNGQHKSSL